MAKYYGKIGFVKYVSGPDSVYTEEVTEENYSGDVIRDYRRNETSSDKLTDDLQLSNEISIIANNFAIENFSYMRYATYLGTKWQIKSARIESPRIILTLGGVYNGSSGPQETA